MHVVHVIEESAGKGNELKDIYIGLLFYHWQSIFLKSYDFRKQIAFLLGARVRRQMGSNCLMGLGSFGVWW